jgi:hypothetical protein
MRRLIVSTFASLDGIMQAPGGPEEDSTGGFTLGGWMFGYGDESMDLSIRFRRPGSRAGARAQDLSDLRSVLAIPAR